MQRCILFLCGKCIRRHIRANKRKIDSDRVDIKSLTCKTHSEFNALDFLLIKWLLARKGDYLGYTKNF